VTGVRGGEAAVRDAVLVLRQVRYENRWFWRNPAAAFFTFVFPLIFLVLFNVIFGNDQLTLHEGSTTQSRFYVPAIAALSVITACYTNIAMTICYTRDDGVLKRIHGTPLPVWAYIVARVLHAVLIGLLLVAIVLAFGRIFYDVPIPSNTLAAFVLTVAIGSGAFSMLGLAITTVIPNAEAAPAIVNFSILPLFFVSDVFINLSDPPAWLDALAHVFPVVHFSKALQTAFNPFEAGAGFEPENLLIIAAWGVAGFVVAVRWFSWEPRT
jgi:ABC-2 type transport system permease protein